MYCIKITTSERIELSILRLTVARLNQLGHEVLKIVIVQAEHHLQLPKANEQSLEANTTTFGIALTCQAQQFRTAST